MIMTEKSEQLRRGRLWILVDRRLYQVVAFCWRCDCRL